MALKSKHETEAVEPIADEVTEEATNSAEIVAELEVTNLELTGQVAALTAELATAKVVTAAEPKGKNQAGKASKAGKYYAKVRSVSDPYTKIVFKAGVANAVPVKPVLGDWTDCQIKAGVLVLA